ncbi:MAG: copper amine oxidase N-terminal domain-containing protein, partial [Vallitaleaceae bacterium]|nr:copper amine oxidase N-terminal domain-containing protein [Vallitaleaceae bacterium]
MKKITGFFLAFFIVFSITTKEVQASVTAVSIEIDGSIVEFNENMGFPFVDEMQRTQVPLRVTLESFGAYVDYDEVNRMAYAVYNDITVHIPIGKNFIYIDGEPVENDTQAVIINGRT